MTGGFTCLLVRAPSPSKSRHVCWWFEFPKHSCLSSSEKTNHKSDLGMSPHQCTGGRWTSNVGFWLLTTKSNTELYVCMIAV